MFLTDLLTADEAAKLLRIGRRTFDAHVACVSACNFDPLRWGIGVQF